MARKAYRRWTNLRVDADGTTVADERRRKNTRRKKPPGITNDQARELAKLQRRLGVKYTGSGMTSAEAGQAIAEAQAALN